MFAEIALRKMWQATHWVALNLRVHLKGMGLRLPASTLLCWALCKSGGTSLGSYLCTCPYLHAKSIASLGLSEVQGVGRILSEAMSCLDKLNALATLHRVEQMGGGRKVKLGGLLAQRGERADCLLMDHYI